MIQIRESIASLYEDVKQHRRHLHQYPEIALDTPNTKNYLIQELNKMGISDIVDGFAQNGFVALLTINEKEDYIAFRADMDALEMEDKLVCEYTSKQAGKAHACGHDGHMAIALGLAQYLVNHKEALQHNVAFIFQPGEEGPGGAEIMIQEGLFTKVPTRCVIGTHVMSDVEKGKVACTKGAMMARNGEIDIQVFGQSAHGAMPQLGKDALVAASQLVVQLQSIVARNIDPFACAVLTIGKMEAGQVRNVISDYAKLEGTLRAFDDDIYESIKQNIMDMSKAIEEAYHVRVDAKVKDCYHVVNNDEQLDALLQSVAKEDYVHQQPKMIAEDFSFYQKEVPGLFYYTGVKDENHTKGIHDACFDFDEHALLNAIEMDVRLLEVLGAFHD